GARVGRGELPRLSVDATRIEQLCQNLIENAIKYRGDQPPVVDISAERVDDFWVFKVRDNGMGIDPAQKDQAFALFTRLTADSAPGSGIGLATCKRIVEHHGGKIWVDSTLGAGSTFCFSIPVS
ncbi:MAG: hypothetical protein HKO07_04365, partial [Pseudomonadales bacterium]|nr:hypothetical protein [Pseudomonadales bacterium]